MTHRLTILAVLIATLFTGTVMAQQTASPKLFPYPEAPKNMDNLYDRSAYLTYHFWDKCNLNNAFNKAERMKEAVGDWIACMPYAPVDTVKYSIDRLIERVIKSGPNTVTLARMVEEKAYSDTSEYYSEFIMLPFAKAASTHKKAKSSDREHFSAIVKRIEGSQTGMTAHPVALITANDSIHAPAPVTNLGEVATDNILLFFYDPSSIDCVMARARMSVDPSIQALISAGMLDIIAIYPGEADDRWRSTTAELPANWLVAASPEADAYFETREKKPAIYYLDKDHKILARNVDPDSIIRAFQIMRSNLATPDRKD